jgi:hypothetical protein
MLSGFAIIAIGRLVRWPTHKDLAHWHLHLLPVKVRGSSITTYSRLRRFSHRQAQAAAALNDHRELSARCASSFHIRAYQITHASKSKLNTHPDIKNTGIHLADKNPLGMF